MSKFQDADRVFCYEYRCDNASMLTPIFRRWISDPLAHLFPVWLAPNLLTLAANILVISSCLFVLLFSETKSVGAGQSTLWLLLPALGIIGYCTLDNADGVHAKRIGASGPLGDFFDHWLDGIAAFLIPIALARLVGLNWLWQSAIVSVAMMAFWTTAWERLHTGWMRLPRLGDVEANVAASGFLAACALFGLSLWDYAFYGLTFAEWFAATVLAGAILAVLGALQRGTFRWQILGIGLSLGFVWTWMLLALRNAGDTSDGRSIAPFLIGLMGAKHVGDLLRSHLIGITYRTFDPILIACGVILCILEVVDMGLLPVHIHELVHLGILSVVGAKLAWQFFSTLKFMCRKLGLRVFSLTGEQPPILKVQDKRSANCARHDHPAKTLVTDVQKQPLTSYRFVHLSIPILIVVGLELILWLWGRFHFEYQHYQSWSEGLWSLGVAIFTIVIAFQVPALVFLSQLRVRHIFNVSLTTAFLILFAAHLFLEHPLDFYFVGNNFAEIFYPQSLAMATQSLSFEEILLGVNATLALALLAITTKAFQTWPRPMNRRLCLGLHLALLGLILVSPLYRHNELSYFVRTALDYSLGRYSYPGIPTVEKYPYVQRPMLSDDVRNTGSRPNIFLILMESFNANFVETTTRDGRAYTPVFNSKIAEGVFVQRFYGNSIQTARAYLPTLCSVLPSYWGKESTNFPKLRVRSLAHVLREHGYRTLFLQSQQSLEFDKIGEFMNHLGFEAVYSMDGKFVAPDEAGFVWGWGLQDDKTFQKAFQYLDDQFRNDSSPVFVVIMTTSHHYPFNEMPSDQRYIYPHPTDRKQFFSNSIHLADKYLGSFFGELSSRQRFNDSLVVITGDHSFPAGEHGNYFNEYRFYEENFRIPLLLWWPSELAPQRIAHSAFSQLDIAPTILDLLDIHTNHHFRGRSVVGPAGESRPVSMVQPYDGTHLCVIDYPFKYVQSLRIPGEYLFNLQKDPDESGNIINQYRDSELLNKFRSEIAKIHLNQKLIENNRIWPSSLHELRSR